MASDVKPWLSELPLKQQAVLLCALRGPDGTPKDTIAKRLCCYLRSLILFSADADHATNPGDRYMDYGDITLNMGLFVMDHEGYPHHFIMHLIHAFEVVGYKHPDKEVRDRCLHFYLRMVAKFHMMPETPEQMDRRLSP